MNNIFYEFLEKNNLEDAIETLPINERFDLPFVTAGGIVPSKVILVSYPLFIKGDMVLIYISSSPRPVLYITDKNKKILPTEEQVEILKKVILASSGKELTDDQYIVTLSPKTMGPMGKTPVTGKVIAWKKGIWKIIKTAIEKSKSKPIDFNVKNPEKEINNDVNKQENVKIGNKTSTKRAELAKHGYSGLKNNAKEENLKSKAEKLTNMANNVKSVIALKTDQEKINSAEIKLDPNFEKIGKLYKKIVNIKQTFEKNVPKMTKNDGFRNQMKKINEIDNAELRQALKEIDITIVSKLSKRYQFTSLQDLLLAYGSNIDKDSKTIDNISWFYENFVNNHFTMKRIFNS